METTESSTILVLLLLVVSASSSRVSLSQASNLFAITHCIWNYFNVTASFPPPFSFSSSFFLFLFFFFFFTLSLQSKFCFSALYST